MKQRTKTYQLKKEAVTRNWHMVDLSGKVLGHTASEIAFLLIGKHKVDYTPHVDGGDYVVVINAKDVVVTGNKTTQKMYYRHSQYPGGFKAESFEKLMQRKPTEIIEKAVYGMLPKNKLRDSRMKRLKIFTGAEHTFQDKLKAKS